MKDRKQRVRYKTKKVSNRNRLSVFKFLKDQIKKKGNNWASDSTLKELLKTAQHKLNNKE